MNAEGGGGVKRYKFPVIKVTIVSNTISHNWKYLREWTLKILTRKKKISLTMYSDSINWTYYDHFAIHTNTEALHCTSKTNIMLYQSYLNLYSIYVYIQINCLKSSQLLFIRRTCQQNLPKFLIKCILQHTFSK